MLLPAIQKIFSTAPKPILFALLGGFGCSLGCGVGEPLLLAIRPTREQVTSGNAASVLVFNPEFNRRLVRENAQTGDIQISLMWQNINDLDLHCIDPQGEEIFYKHKRSRSGGALDVDMNVSAPLSTEPVENIYWAFGKAPSGSYKVYVNHFKNQGGKDPTHFIVGIKMGADAKEVSGDITSGEAKRLIQTFYFNQTAPPPSQWQIWAPIGLIGIWTALLAIGLSTALTSGQNILLRKVWLSPKQGVSILGGGLLTGLIAGSLSQTFFSSLAQFEVLSVVGRLVGWTLLGAMLGFGMSFVIPNLPKRKSLGAGAIGGFLGSIAFLSALGTLTDSLARLCGAFILGAAIGLMIAIAEKMAREASLIVVWGPNEKTVINLGERPVILGSSGDAHLYLPKEKGFPEVAALVTFRKGRIEMQNKMTNSTHELKSGNKLQLGTLTIEVKTDTL